MVGAWELFIGLKKKNEWINKCPETPYEVGGTILFSYKTHHASLVSPYSKLGQQIWKGQSSIPGLGRSPREGHGIALQYSHLENPVDRGAWWATVHGVAESDTTDQVTLSQFQWIHLHVSRMFLGRFLQNQRAPKCNSEAKQHRNSINDQSPIHTIISSHKHMFLWPQSPYNVSMQISVSVCWRQRPHV